MAELGMIHSLSQLLVLAEVAAEMGIADKGAASFDEEEAAVVIGVSVDKVREVLLLLQTSRLIELVEDDSNGHDDDKQSITTTHMQQTRWHLTPGVVDSLLQVENQLSKERSEACERYAVHYLRRFHKVSVAWNTGDNVAGALKDLRSFREKLVYILLECDLSGDLLIPLFECLWEGASLMRAELLDVWDMVFKRLERLAELAVAKQGKAPQVVNVVPPLPSTRAANTPIPRQQMFDLIFGWVCVRLSQPDRALELISHVQPPTITSQRLHIQAMVVKGTALDFHATAEGDLLQAVLLYQHAVMICDELGIIANPEKATVLIHLSRVHKHLKRYSKALEYGRAALQMRQELHGIEHVDSASAMTDIGTILDEMENTDGAMMEYTQALAIYEEILGETHEDTAAPAVNMGLIYVKLGDYENALDAFKFSLRIYEHVGLISEAQAICVNCARVCELMSQDTYAIEFYKRAVDYCVRMYGDLDERTAVLHFNIGATYARMNNWQQAVAHLTIARDSVFQSSGPDSELSRRVDKTLTQAHTDASNSLASPSSCVIS